MPFIWAFSELIAIYFSIFEINCNLFQRFRNCVTCFALIYWTGLNHTPAVNVVVWKISHFFYGPPKIEDKFKWRNPQVIKLIACLLSLSFPSASSSPVSLIAVKHRVMGRITAIVPATDIKVKVRWVNS